MSHFKGYLTAALMVLSLTGIAADPIPTPTPTPVVVAPPVVTPPPVTFASEGDSISALADNAGNIIRWSWVRDAAVAGGVKYIGVYMRAGATTAELVRNAKPTLANVMVVMGGTNDVSTGVPTSSTLNNIAAVFGHTGGKVKILSAVAPRNIYPAQTLTLNYWLRQLAKQHGYVFIDPWVSVRNANGTWKAGANSDSTHPSVATGQIVGEILRAAMVQYAG